ncbi:hypothetical protein P4H65_20160 [Paenibacillus chitinolyticus]|uniref:hypothetical protein n=1 Tax=Paenibacillus chitinolyticus TaxID=79263 RepID=UPI002DBEABFB|nr:hypothetical protein [Paenibacillus chitinolyticus]MEC0248114.1 hypothetical protein [Paenibacillus chitinolyticus]
MRSEKGTESADGGKRLLTWRYYSLFLLLTIGLEYGAFVAGRLPFGDELTGFLVMMAVLAFSVLLALFTFVFGLLTCLVNRQHVLIVPCALLTAGLYLAIIKWEGM